MTYYNTNRESGKTLKESQQQTETQEARVLEYFRTHPYGRYTVHHIRRVVMAGSPHSSAQRAITNLTYAGLLEKTDEMHMEEWGKQVHTWRLKPKEESKPFGAINQATQASLF